MEVEAAVEAAVEAEAVAAEAEVVAEAAAAAAAGRAGPPRRSARYAWVTAPRTPHHWATPPWPSVRHATMVHVHVRVRLTSLWSMAIEHGCGTWGHGAIAHLTTTILTMTSDAPRCGRGPGATPVLSHLARVSLLVSIAIVSIAPSQPPR